MRSSPASRLDELVEGGLISPSTRNPLPDDVMCHQVRVALARNLPEVTEVPPHDRTMVIAGNGPSLKELPPIYGEKALPYDIFALGGAHDWLIDRGVVPHAWINADPLPWVANYVTKPHKSVTYYVASHSHKFLFAALEGHKVVVWHDNVGEPTFEEIKKHRNEGIMIAGGSSGATRAPFLGEALGYRKFIFYGVDGSGDHLGDVQRVNEYFPVEVNGKEFQTTVQFAHQTLCLQKIARMPGWKVQVRGGGLAAEACRV